MSYTPNDIAGLFPDLESIGDPGLREKVAVVWIEAMTTGCGGTGWTIEELRSIPFTLLAGEINLTFIEHINSCARQCIAIEGVLRKIYGDRVPVNHDHLLAGALLADVGKPLEYDKDKHGLPPEVMHIVATHSHEGDKVQRSIESIIFHHADFVDFDIAKYLGRGGGA